ncbi:MAG: G5 domain-containing protein [Anaerolineae bacterium]
MRLVQARLPWLIILLLCLLGGCQTSKRVVIVADGQQRVIQTSVATVDEALREAGVKLGDQDRVEPPGYTPLDRATTIHVVRVEIVTETHRESLDFARKLTHDETVPDGKMRVIQLGASGEVEVTYQVTREDHLEISRREVGRTILKPPQDEILALGTQNSLAAVDIQGTLAYLARGNAWVMRNNSKDKRPLTVEGDLDGRVFDLSPDGRYLIFTRQNSQNLNSLWIADTVVLDEKPRPLPLRDLLYAQWAPDGSPQIAYSTGDRTAGAPGWKAHNDLAIATLSGISATIPITTSVLTSGGISSTVQITPTGTVSLTISTDTPITITTRLVISPAVTTVYGWWGGNFAWAPDANIFAYAFANQVGMINAATGQRRAIKTFAFYNTRAEWVWVPPLTWSPDSRFVAATIHAPPPGAGLLEDSPAFDTWVLARDNSVNLPLIQGTGMWAAPVWSPRDQQGESRLAYGVALNTADTERSSYALYVVNRDGSGRTRILPQGHENGVDIVQLAWAPNASQLVAIREGDVWLYDFAKGLWFQLTANGDSRLPRWR